MIHDGDRNARAVYDSASGKWRTYGELASDVRRTVDALDAPGKSLVFCFCRNDYPALCAYLAGLERGHAAALLDENLSEPFRRTLIDIYRPDFIVHSPACISTLAGSDYELADATGPIVLRRVSREAGDIHPAVCLLLSTSGSTGTPKFVRLTEANLIANARSIIHGLGIEPSDRAITSLPFHYSFGLSVINTHLLAGASLVLTNESITVRSFWNTARDLGCTSIAGVPYSYQIFDRLGIPGDDLPSLSTMTQAGGKLHNNLAQKYHDRMRARQGRFFVMYGQTEATARIAILPPDWLPQKLGSAGRPILNGKIEIMDGDRPVTGSAGEVVYSGPNVMMGYASTRADLAKGDEQESRLRTGDLGYVDGDGFLFITGRLNRFTKISGMRLNLDEVESMLKDYGPSAVIGVDEKVVIFLEGQVESVLSECRQECARKLSLHHRLVDLRSIPKLPLKANGKIDYSTLEQAARC